MPRLVQTVTLSQDFQVASAMATWPRIRAFMKCMERKPNPRIFITINLMEASALECKKPQIAESREQ